MRPFLEREITELSWTMCVDSMDRYIRQKAADESIPGYAYAILRKDSIYSKKVQGISNLQTKERIHDHTVFRLASISKCFAGALAVVMERNNVIQLDQPLKNQLPSFQLSNPTYTNQITLRQTLNHSSGLIEYALAGNIKAKQSSQKIYESLKYAPFVASPGDTFAYQNAIFSVISTLGEKVMDRSFSFLIDSFFFKTLGMTTASVGYNGLRASKSIAFPHTKVKGKWQTREPEDRWYNVSPAAGVNASLDDMIQWLRALLGSNDQVLTLTDRQSMFSFDLAIQDDSDYYETWAPGLDSAGYGLGLRIMYYKGTKVVYHGGWVRGYRPEMVIIPELNFGFVFLCNADKNELSTDCVPHLLSLIDSYIGFE